jgi:23S rRNA pseudouridine2605 synthase
MKRRAAAGVALERALSKLGAASRTEARAMILAGRVRVDGRVVTNPATRVVPEGVRLTIDGSSIRRSSWRAIAFHKPRGTIATRHDPQGRRTIFDVLGEAGAGLVTVGGRVGDDTARALEHGRDLPGARGLERLQAARVIIRKASGRESHLTVDLTEGKNREVRRLFDSAGHEVTRLQRVAFGSIELGDLAPGEWKELTREDFEAELR